jgi:hypothetical protein
MVGSLPSAAKQQQKGPKMQNFRAHVKTAQRRVDFLKEKSNNPQKRFNSWDRAELSSLQALLRIANLYEDSREDGGSHVENVMYMARDVLTELGEENRDVLDEDALERIDHAKRKLTEGINMIHRMADATEDAG